MSQPGDILIIEDDPAVARSLQAGLEREGYRVTWKPTGAEGISHARAHSPHLIILDVRLPDGAGFDVGASLPKSVDDIMDGEGHRGLSLIRAFMDEVRFNEKGNELQMILNDLRLSSEQPSE